MGTMLCLGGSTRPGSLTSALLSRAARLASEAGFKTDSFGTVELRSLFEPDPTYEADPAVQRLGEAVRKAKTIFVATPIYGGTLSGGVKNILDTLHLFKNGETGPLQGKRAVVAAVGGGSLAGKYEYQPAATAALEVSLQNLGAWVSPRHLEFSELMFDGDGELRDVLARDALRTAVSGLVDASAGSK